MNLYHYYDKTIGPFKNLSDLPINEARRIMEHISRDNPESFCAKRSPDYMMYRLYYEEILRREFLKKGGIIKRHAPHYMVIGKNDFLSNWYTNSAYIEIPIENFDLRSVSFTYGDSHPTFSGKINDGKEYRGKLYTYDEILKIIDKYGLPQDWNADGNKGPERYVEAHIWTDDCVNDYIEAFYGK